MGIAFPLILLNLNCGVFRNYGEKKFNYSTGSSNYSTVNTWCRIVKIKCRIVAYFCLKLFHTGKTWRTNVLLFRIPRILVYVTWNKNFHWALVRLHRKGSSSNISCFRKSAESLPHMTIVLLRTQTTIIKKNMNFWIYEQKILWKIYIYI